MTHVTLTVRWVGHEVLYQMGSCATERGRPARPVITNSGRAGGTAAERHTGEPGRAGRPRSVAQRTL